MCQHIHTLEIDNKTHAEIRTYHNRIAAFNPQTGDWIMETVKPGVGKYARRTNSRIEPGTDTNRIVINQCPVCGKELPSNPLESDD